VSGAGLSTQFPGRQNVSIFGYLSLLDPLGTIGGGCPVPRGLYMQYLIRGVTRKTPVSHIWIGDDTECRMASTGGIDMANPRRKWRVVNERIGKLCKMCEVNYAKRIPTREYYGT